MKCGENNVLRYSTRLQTCMCIFLRIFSDRHPLHNYTTLQLLFSEKLPLHYNYNYFFSKNFFTPLQLQLLFFKKFSYSTTTTFFQNFSSSTTTTTTTFFQTFSIQNKYNFRCNQNFSIFEIGRRNQALQIFLHLKNGINIAY